MTNLKDLKWHLLSNTDSVSIFFVELESKFLYRAQLFHEMA